MIRTFCFHDFWYRCHLVWCGSGLGYVWYICRGRIRKAVDREDSHVVVAIFFIRGEPFFDVILIRTRNSLWPNLFIFYTWPYLFPNLYRHVHSSSYLLLFVPSRGRRHIFIFAVLSMLNRKTLPFISRPTDSTLDSLARPSSEPFDRDDDVYVFSSPCVYISCSRKPLFWAFVHSILFPSVYAVDDEKCLCSSSSCVQGSRGRQFDIRVTLCSTWHVRFKLKKKH